jgi:hypothetical protein
MTISFPLQESEREFAREQARLLIEHLEGNDFEYDFVARHAMDLVEVAETAWESPYAVQRTVVHG